MLTWVGKTAVSSTCLLVWDTVTSSWSWSRVSLLSWLVRDMWLTRPRCSAWSSVLQSPIVTLRWHWRTKKFTIFGYWDAFTDKLKFFLCSEYCEYLRTMYIDVKIVEHSPAALSPAGWPGPWCRRGPGCCLHGWWWWPAPAGRPAGPAWPPPPPPAQPADQPGVTHHT